LPDAKNVFYPFDGDRFVTARLTNLNYREKPALHTTVDLGIPVDKINMKPELYNPDPDANPILDELDELLFGEGKVAPAYIPKKQDKPLKLQKMESWQPDDTHEINPMVAKYGIDILDELVDVDEMRDNLSEKIERGFSFTKSHKIHDHPTRPGVVAVKTWYILPHFDQIDKKFVHLVNPDDPVSIEKHCMVPGNQKGQRILQEFTKSSTENQAVTGTAMDDELNPNKMHTFDHQHDYLFFNKETKVVQKDIVLEEKFAFFLENSKKMALIRHVDKEVTLRRELKKTKFNADEPEERIQNLKVKTRKAYTKEADIKRKKLAKYERNLVAKYGITDFIEEPKEPEYEEEFYEEEEAAMDQEDLGARDIDREYRDREFRDREYRDREYKAQAQQKYSSNQRKDYGAAQDRYPARRPDFDDGEEHYSDGVEDLNNRKGRRYGSSGDGGSSSGSGTGSDVGSEGNSQGGPEGDYDSELDDDFDPEEVEKRQEKERAVKKAKRAEKDEIRAERKQERKRQRAENEGQYVGGGDAMAQEETEMPKKRKLKKIRDTEYQDPKEKHLQTYLASSEDENL